MKINMKNFNELSIGDIFYKIVTDSSAAEKPLIETIEVKNIQLNDKNCLQINEYKGYIGFPMQGSMASQAPMFEIRICYVIEVLLDESKTNILKIKDGFYTTDASLKNDLVKDAGLQFIKKYESEISNLEDKIKKIRITYWEYLNLKI